MRIGIDGSCLSNRRGFGRFAREQLRALAAAGSPDEFVVFVDAPSADGAEIPAAFDRVVVDVREAPTRAASAGGRRRLGDMLRMGRAASRAGLDLLYFPSSYSVFPAWGVGRVVVAIHDTLGHARPDLVFPGGRGRLAWTIKEHFAARRADAIVTVSAAARADLIAWFGLPPGRVHLVTEGPDAAFRPTAPGPESDAALARSGLDPAARFLLYVGGLSPHKNLPRLIDAMARRPDDGTRLVLVGDLGDVFHTHVPALREQIGRLGLDRRVTLAGFVPDADLAHLYSRARALVQPSLMEGFGLPPVEAMACGTPVAYSRAGSLPEVVGDAGVDFDPLDPASIAAAIGRILGDDALRDDLAARALARSARFTWEASARMLLACFDAVIGGDRRGP